MIVVHTLDRLGRTVRDTLNLIHELAERGVGVRNRADPIRVDSSNPTDPMARSPSCCSPCSGRWNAPTPSSGPPTPAPSRPPRAAGAAGRSPSTRAKLDYAAHLRAAGHTIAEIVTKTGIPPASLYRHLPPRPPEPVTAGELPAAAVS